MSRILIATAAVTLLAASAAVAQPSIGVYNVKTDGGAACNGVTNDLSAIQNLINTVPGGSTIVFPNLFCNVRGTIVVNKQLVIRGGGRFSSIVTQDTAGASMFAVTTSAPVEFHDLYLRYASQQTSGACVTVGQVPGTPTNHYSVFSGVKFEYCYVGISFDRAAFWTVRNSVFQPVYVGLQIENSNHSDEGDSLIRDSMFVTTDELGNPAGGFGIQWRSSGGLRVNNNKMQNVGYGVLVWPKPGVQTAIVKLHGNSIEGCKYACFMLTTTWPPPSDGAVAFIEVTGNELATFPGAAGAFAVAIDSPQAQEFIVADNHLFLLGNETTAVGLVSGQNAVVEGNISTNGGYADTHGLRVFPGFANATIAENGYVGLANELTNSSATTRLNTVKGWNWSTLSGWTAPANGSSVYCSDCKGPANPSYVPGAVCTGAGSGAQARVVAGAWRCW